MPENEYVKKIVEEAVGKLDENPRQSVSHRSDHAERVWKRAKMIACKIMETQNIVIDMEALKIACYLHDLNEPYEGEKGDHITASRTDADELMFYAGYYEDRIAKVLRIMSEHSSEKIKMPTSIEAQILYDADKLDGLGGIGIARVFALCGQQGKNIAETVKWYREKIKKARPYMQTDIGKKLAAKQLKYVLSFLDRIEKEQKELEAI